VSSSLVQLFFTSRIYALSRRWVVALLGWVGTVAKIARGLTLIIVSSKSEKYKGILEEHAVLVPSFIAVAAVEVYNTATLCIILWSMRPQINSNTRRTIKKLVAWSLQTGFLISAFAVVIAILIVLSPNTGIWMAPFIMLPKLFSLTLLTTLNSRAHIRRAMIREPVTFSIMDDFRAATQSVHSESPPIRLELANRQAKDSHMENGEMTKTVHQHLEDNPVV